MPRKYRQTSPEIKAKAVLEALKENEEIAVIAARYEIDPRNLKEWKKQFIENSASVFDKQEEKRLKEELKERQKQIDLMSKKIGEQTIFEDWF